MAIELLPEIGLNIASGIISLGKFINFNNGSINLIIISMIPELLNVPTAKKRPTSVGKILITIFIPSFAPSINLSNTSFFSMNP